MPTVHHYLDDDDCSGRNHDSLTFNQVKNKNLRKPRLTSPVRLSVWLASSRNIIHSDSNDSLTAVSRESFQILDSKCAEQSANRCNFGLVWLLY